MSETGQKAEHKKTIRYDENPFLSELTINKKSRQVKISSMGKDDNVIVNTNTGESHGTSVVTYKAVDDAEFVKLFTANIAMTFDLNKAGHKVLQLLIWMVQKEAIGRDIVRLNKFTLDDFQASFNMKAFSLSVYKKGLTELEEAQIIAKARQAGDYYINPSFMFNGDRIAFTKIIEKKSAAKKRIAEEQLSLEGLDDGKGFPEHLEEQK